MRLVTPTAARWLAVLVVVGSASVALAQRFVWPPAAGDRMADNTAPAASTAAPGDEEPPLNLASRADETPVSRPFATVTAAAMPTPSPAPAGGNRLDWQILENPNGPHTALIFDPVRQVFAVYHVDSASGQIMLKSVRNLSADLRLPQFNSSNPAPKDIQSMLDEAR
ncbi:hypothetical protein Pla108_11560 [Botrimarina colliarenosi]|uniref:Uncharacterized protein n=1 Tax=Botrimarina colliarenosi TaxID=2528001 RepID=A0A5C6AKN0_9BACT|nr:hypothetical protein [Botrimarina colliarenosi]TWU00210.1 hypothetical protein Pla108_11560 [Botrimarina colliarenosi]